MQAWIVKNLKAIFWAGLIALTLRSCTVEPFRIPSGSMVPTLIVGDYLFSNKTAYGFSRYSFPFGIPFTGKSNRIFYKEPKRGEIALFKLPTNTRIEYIKRIIGLPGDKIQMKDGRLYINDTLVERTWVGQYEDGGLMFNRYIEKLPGGVEHSIIELSDDMPQDNTPAFFVPKDHFFMLGDNRDNSKDSRFSDVGFVPKLNLFARASFIFYSNEDGILPGLIEVWKWRGQRMFTWIK